MRFTGSDAEVALARPGHKPEFDQWRWAEMGELVGLIVPFKRAVYEQVLAEFAHLAGSRG
jgi:putative (di)nucleoside polyphosphate hydrolase